jgi:Uma2 family endonuclease
MNYGDGELEDRHAAEYDHNVVQQTILLWFHHEGVTHPPRDRIAHEAERKPGAIPDASIFASDLPIKQVFARPQLIAIEVLSPEDRHSKMDKTIRNYLDFGVRYV